MIDTLYKINSLENLYKMSFYKTDKWDIGNEDNFLNTGVYQLKGPSSKLKREFVGSQAFLLVFNTSTDDKGYITQIAISYNEISTPLAIRRRRSVADGGEWTSWKYSTFI